MSCYHKFIYDLQLEYVDWEVSTLFVGTFNPGWASCTNNNSEWFYGRTARNSFWNSLSLLHEGYKIESGKSEWLDFCRRNELAVTDILACIDNADENNPIHQTKICKFKDDDLAQFDVTINNIPQILNEHPKIRQVCITRQTLTEFWEDIFQDLLTYIDAHNNISLIKLRSPSRGAISGVEGDHSLFVANRWIQQGYQLF
ncbi:MAG: hypothetical protein JSR12_11485 [Bacteroidetes bacterium]|nr:hypothetical protein [Bacteroidota bacterium]